MPPKATSQQINEKLEELSTFVQQNRELLAGRGPTTLLKAFRQNESSEERKWYTFLKKHDKTFTTSQKEHIQRTLLLLHEAKSSSSAVVSTAASTEYRDIGQPHSGVSSPEEDLSLIHI